jgi:hypothetical protein
MTHVCERGGDVPVRRARGVFANCGMDVATELCLLQLIGDTCVSLLTDSWVQVLLYFFTTSVSFFLGKVTVGG